MLLSIVPAAFPQIARVQTDRPAGIVLDASDAFRIQPVVKTQLPVLTGELVYDGDTLQTGRNPLQVALCQIAWVVRGQSRVTIQAGTLKVISGGVDRAAPPAVCDLPSAQRFPLAETRAPSKEPPPDGSPSPRPQRIAALAPDDRKALQEKLPSVEAAIRRNALDVAARIARANLLLRYHLPADAQYEFQAIGRDFPGAEWTRSIRILPEDDAKQSTAPGKTFALLIGISAYRADTGIRSLRYAARDAITFRDFLKSDRGGSLPDSQIDLLTDEGATREKIDNALNGFVRDARGPGNTLIVLIAAHGANVPSANAEAGSEDPQPYILTHEGNTQDLATAGIAMSRLRESIVQQIASFKQVLVYLDVCHAGSLWPVKVEPKAISRETSQALATRAGNLGVMLATSPDEDAPNTLAYESELLDRHGAFTYYVLSGLNGGVEPTEKGTVLFDDLENDVNAKVRKATSNRQRPFGHSSRPGLVVVENAKAEGIKIEPPVHLPIVAEQPRGFGGPGGPNAESVDPFQAALQSGRLLPGDGKDNAADLLNAMRPQIDAARYGALREQLRLALEERGQDVILQYLRGAQPPLRLQDFERCRDYFQAALEIFPDSPYDESRRDFSAGRALVFQRRYGEAIVLLERSIRLDPTRAYAYNALGIAFLDQFPYHNELGPRAEAAFQDAIHFAPYWAYPRHNLALLYVARGEYDRAFDALNAAARLAPAYSYLPYTIGLLNQQLNRVEEARSYYRKALDLAQQMRDRGADSRVPGRWPERAEILNALGSLEDNQNRGRSAERFYRSALSEDPQTVSARLNLAARLTESGRSSPEAESLWRQAIVEDPYAIAPRMALGLYLQAHRRDAEAAAQFEEVIRLEPVSSQARLHLAQALLRTGQPAGAVSQLEEVQRLDDQDSVTAELLGDAFDAMNRVSEARDAWQKALGLSKSAGDARARQRIESKIRQSGGR